MTAHHLAMHGIVNCANWSWNCRAAFCCQVGLAQFFSAARSTYESRFDADAGWRDPILLSASGLTCEWRSHSRNDSIGITNVLIRFSTTNERRTERRSAGILNYR